MPSPGVLCRVALVRTDVSEEHIAPIISSEMYSKNKLALQSDHFSIKIVAPNDIKTKTVVDSFAFELQLPATKCVFLCISLQHASVASYC
jgi:hypothetical protein